MYKILHQAEYKKLVNYKKRKYKESLTNLLGNAMENDPQSAWKIINELRNDSLPADKAEKNYWNSMVYTFSGLIK